MHVIEGWLDFQIHDLVICQDEIVWKMVESHNSGDDEAFKKAFKDYEYTSDIIYLGRTMLDKGLKTWDLKWAFETGNMSKCNFDMLEQDFLKLGITREDYEKKWKRE